MNQSKEGAEKDLYIVSEMLENCEFLINEETSIGDASSGYRVFGSDRRFRQPLPFAWVGERVRQIVSEVVSRRVCQKVYAAKGYYCEHFRKPRMGIPVNSFCTEPLLRNSEISYQEVAGHWD